MTSPFIRIITSLSMAGLLSACSAMDRLSEIGTGPQFAPLNVPVTQDSRYASMGQPFTPQPPASLSIPPYGEPASTNSLWRAGSRSFFRDPRASRVGDIITVNISVADTAKLSNSTARSRANSDDASLNNFFGLEGQLNKILPSDGDAANLVKMGSNTSNQGAGTVDRSEAINMTLAAVVTQILPNGNLIIGGHQQVRVNSELRDLQVSGVVRTEDISNANTINLAQIAEARVSYGGRGTVSDVQKPRYGSEIYDTLMPF
jgi:flagellar L-ring protein precursor FlgH